MTHFQLLLQAIYQQTPISHSCWMLILIYFNRVFKMQLKLKMGN
jgi:hypothetical protein